VARRRWQVQTLGCGQSNRNVGKVAKFGGVALLVGEGAVGIWSDFQSQKRASRQAADLRAWTIVAGQIADETVQSWRAAATEAVHAMCDEDLRTIGRQRLALLASMSKTDSTVRALHKLDDEILGALGKLSPGSARPT
jgi:hypothetical protein